MNSILLQSILFILGHPMPNALSQADRTIPRIGFIPLHPNDNHCLIGYRSNARADELIDEATLRQNAALGLLIALSDTHNLNELCSNSLSQCIKTVHILCSDALALHNAAYEVQQKEMATTDL